MGIPIMLTVQNRRVLVVGGGAVGFRKAMAFWDQGANVTCISPEFCQAFIQKCKQDGLERLTLIYEPIQISHIEGYDFVVAATNDDAVNEGVYHWCKSRGIMCLTTHAHFDSDFSFMAHKRLDDLVVALSTCGRAPGLSKSLLDKVFKAITDEDIARLNQYAKTRKERLTQAGGQHEL